MFKSKTPRAFVRGVFHLTREKRPAAKRCAMEYLGFKHSTETHKYEIIHENQNAVFETEIRNQLELWPIFGQISFEFYCVISS